MSRKLARLALHWLVVISLVTAGLVAPAQAATHALEAAAAAQMAQAMAGMPCDDMGATVPATGEPCECCTPASCDLSLCLGTACLPALPRLAASVPSGSIDLRWKAPVVPWPVMETPLRPPIG